MTLFIPVGIPGSGKSYLGWAWFDWDERVSPDDYRRILTGDVSNQHANKTVFKIVHEVVRERLNNGLDVYLDATNLQPKLWPHTAEEVVVINMVTPHDVSVERNRNRDRVVPDHAMRKMIDRYRSAMHDPILTHCTMVNSDVFDRGDFDE